MVMVPDALLRKWDLDYCQMNTSYPELAYGK